MLKLLANAVIALIVIWTITVSASKFLGITIYFPWATSSAEEIPINRLQTVRIAILLTLAVLALISNIWFSFFDNVVAPFSKYKPLLAMFRGTHSQGFLDLKKMRP